MKQNLQAIIIPYIILAILAGLLLWYVKRQITKAGSGLLEGLGIKESEADKEAERTNEELTYSAFSPEFFQTAAATKAKALILTKATGDKLAKQLYNSHGFINDDESQMVDVFKQLKTKSQVSFLAHIFAYNYKTDMQTFLKNYFDEDDEYKAVLRYVNQLPNYNVAK